MCDAVSFYFAVSIQFSMKWKLKFGREPLRSGYTTRRYAVEYGMAKEAAEEELDAEEAGGERNQTLEESCNIISKKKENPVHVSSSECERRTSI